MAAMHPMEPDHVHEEIELQLPGLLQLHARVGGPGAAVARLLPRARPDAALRLHEDGAPDPAVVPTRERWVLKSPQHLEQLGPLLATFPDATVVVTHRDPVAVVQSHDHHGLLRRPHRLPDTSARVVPGLLDRAHRRVARRVVARPAPPARAIAPWTSTSTSTWPTRWATLERVYDCAGMELTAQARAEVAGYQHAHPRGKEGRVVYDLRRDFATTPEEVRARFGAYLDRFPVRIGGGMSIAGPGGPPHRHAAGQGAPPAGLRRPGPPGRRRDLPLGRLHRGLHAPDRDGRVIVNTGMGFEAPHHKRVFDAVRPGPTHYVVTTQAHVDHLGGVDLFKEADTVYVAQENNQACQADDARIRSLRMRTAGIWFDTLGTDARRIARENPGVSMRQSEPVPDVTFDDRLELDADGLDMELVAAVGETIDSLIVWLPERRTALVSNLFGPLFPHFPNLNTLRGDRYRFVEPYLESVRKVRALRPDVLVTGRHEPIVGAELIDASLERLSGAVDYVHQRALEGFNAGTDVWTLMREIELPAAPPGRPGLRDGLLGGAHPVGELRGLVQAPIDHRALSRLRTGCDLRPGDGPRPRGCPGAGRGCPGTGRRDGGHPDRRGARSPPPRRGGATVGAVPGAHPLARTRRGCQLLGERLAARPDSQRWGSDGP